MERPKNGRVLIVEPDRKLATRMAGRAPRCAGDVPVIVARPQVGPARIVTADRHLGHPYDPDTAALLLYRVRGVRHHREEELARPTNTERVGQVLRG